MLEHLFFLPIDSKSTFFLDWLWFPGLKSPVVFRPNNTVALNEPPHIL